jgi:hypothetical protein
MNHNMFVLCKESEGGNVVVFYLKDKSILYVLVLFHKR